MSIDRELSDHLGPEMFEQFKQAFLICMIKRLVDENNELNIPVDEIDSVGGDRIDITCNADRSFTFKLTRRQ